MVEMERAQSRKRADMEAARFNEIEIDLMGLLYQLLENLKYIVAAALLGAMIAAAYTVEFITPLYAATAKLYVMNSGDSAINLADLQIGTYLTNDYLEVFKTWEVHEMVLSDLKLDYSYEQLQSKLKVTHPNDTRILYITVTSAIPGEAMRIANGYATVVRKYISEKMAAEEPNVLSAATLPLLPISPNRTVNVLLGFLLGGFLVGGIVIAQFITDDRLKTADDVRAYAGMPTLALVPLMGEHDRRAGRKTSRRRK